ncbi:hypothetical protein TKK_0015356 [Trichogramma kaykai]
MLLDPGAVSSWIGVQPAKLLQSKIKKSSCYMEGPRGEITPDDGKLTLTISLENSKIDWTFGVMKSLKYEIVMGINLLMALKITTCFNTLKWWTPAGVKHPFNPKQDKSKLVIQAVGAIGGLKSPEEAEKEIISELVEKLIPPASDTCKAAKITPHTIDVQGHHPIRQHPRRIAQKLLKAAHEEVDSHNERKCFSKHTIHRNLVTSDARRLLNVFHSCTTGRKCVPTLISTSGSAVSVNCTKYRSNYRQG